MSDSDAEELSVGAPSPISAKERHHHGSNMIIMDGDEEGSSSVSSFRIRNEGVDTINDSNGASQRHPTCALCKNHQTISTLKGHKRYCPWRQCMCELCYGTNKKRKINAEQVALRRAQAQDEELRKKGIIQQLERISSSSASTITTPSSIQQSPSPDCGKARPSRSEHQHSMPGREERAPKVKIDAPARPTPAAGCHQSSPVVFGQQLSLGSILMGQNVSLLRHSVCEKRLGFEMLGFLFRIIQDVKAEIERVSFQLNEIHHEIQIKIHSGNVNFAPNPNLVYGQDPLQNGNPVPPVSIHHYQIPSSFQTQFRATVINGPHPPTPNFISQLIVFFSLFIDLFLLARDIILDYCLFLLSLHLMLFHFFFWNLYRFCFFMASFLRTLLLLKLVKNSNLPTKTPPFCFD
uniref:Doublesex 1 n=1 Tax=Daphnia carinata TaxID=120202 RepID=A0A077H6M8_9CRUS|nr:doublesex 1 [Daphnia carinata]